MRRLLTIAVALMALTPLVAASTATAAGERLTTHDLLSKRQAASVFPGLKGGTRLEGRSGIVAPRFVKTHGRLKCDRYRVFKGVSRRDAYFFNVNVPRSMTLDQDVTRFRTVRRAKALMRYYRTYLRTCRGTHRTTDGQGGKAWMKVRRWQPPRIGADSIGVYEAFIQYGGADWTRTIVARTGRTVTVQEVIPYVGKVGTKRAIRISRKAISNLR